MDKYIKVLENLLNDFKEEVKNIDKDDWKLGDPGSWTDNIRASEKLLKELKAEQEVERVIGVLNITKKEIPTSLRKKITDNELYTYMDTHDLLEHLYSVDGIITQAQESGIPINREENKALGKLQGMMNERNCGYFRIVKF
jgi:hypothetical protein